MTPVNSDDTYKLTVFISEDNGRTWFSPKSLKGDIGLQKGYGRRVIEWDIFADVDDLEGEVKVKIKAKVYKSPSEKISELLFNVSEEKKENENGLYFFFNYPNFTFNNSAFKKKIDDVKKKINTNILDVLLIDYTNMKCRKSLKILILVSTSNELIKLLI